MTDSYTLLDAIREERDLEREYPGVARAKQNFNTVVNLTQGNDND